MKNSKTVVKVYIGDNLDEKKLKGIVEGKEYDKLGIHLLFDGEYSNKEKWKGKIYEFFDGKLISEGEYLNGKKNGKGKEYDDEGNIFFEGEYLDDKRIIN